VLTKKWYRIATIYIENHFELSNTFLQEDASSKDTLKGKLALKQYARKVGVDVDH